MSIGKSWLKLQNNLLLKKKHIHDELSGALYFMGEDKSENIISMSFIY